jgi:hypothetical protein
MGRKGALMTLFRKSLVLFALIASIPSAAMAEVYNGNNGQMVDGVISGYVVYIGYNPAAFNLGIEDANGVRYMVNGDDLADFQVPLEKAYDTWRPVTLSVSNGTIGSVWLQ